MYLILFSFCRQLQNEVQKAEQEVSDSSNKFKDVKNKYITEKETYSAKIKELRTVQIKTKHLADDINLLRKEIQRLEWYYDLI